MELAGFWASNRISCQVPNSLDEELQPITIKENNRIHKDLYINCFLRPKLQSKIQL